MREMSLHDKSMSFWAKRAAARRYRLRRLTASNPTEIDS
jgi:hypothetical protein